MLFSKENDTSHPSVHFHNAEIQWQSIAKNLGLLLVEKLSFLEHIGKEKESNNRVEVNLTRKLSLLIRRLCVFYQTSSGLCLQSIESVLLNQ